MMQQRGLAAMLAGLLGTVCVAAEPTSGGSSPHRKSSTVAAPKQLPTTVVLVAQQTPQPVASAPARAAHPPAACPCVAGRPVRSFICGNDRYDPVIRDIRLVPNSYMLPGGDFGRRETLPILPAREFGYFVTPRH